MATKKGSITVHNNKLNIYYVLVQTICETELSVVILHSPAAVLNIPTPAVATEWVMDTSVLLNFGFGPRTCVRQWDVSRHDPCGALERAEDETALMSFCRHRGNNLAHAATEPRKIRDLRS